MSRTRLPYHYEDIPSRGAAARFRVGDADDDAIISFPTEKEARDFVREANSKWIPLMTSPGWRY